MKSTERSFLLTNGGFNISPDLADDFRVGIQLYARRIGELGQGKIDIDWAFADYRIKPYVGIRAGKVKTPLGLYNDSQDMDFLHTWGAPAAIAVSGGSAELEYCSSRRRCLRPDPDHCCPN
ncbi:MAG: hypothetical protein GY906_32890 [bacterium]|nr:hypothetical protein [bacterium]